VPLNVTLAQAKGIEFERSYQRKQAKAYIHSYIQIYVFIYWFNVPYGLSSSEFRKHKTKFTSMALINAFEMINADKAQRSKDRLYSKAIHIDKNAFI